MRISIVGAGCVGVVSAVCFADRGHSVVVSDKSKTRIDQLSHGRLPFYESGLDELFSRSASRLSFTTDTVAAVEGSELTFISVGTPSRS